LKENFEIGTRSKMAVEVGQKTKNKSPKKGHGKGKEKKKKE